MEQQWVINSLSPFFSNLFVSELESYIKKKKTTILRILLEYTELFSLVNNRISFNYFKIKLVKHEIHRKLLEASENLDIIKCDNSMNNDRGSITFSSLCNIINSPIISIDKCVTSKKNKSSLVRTEVLFVFCIVPSSSKNWALGNCSSCRDVNPTD